MGDFLETIGADEPLFNLIVKELDNRPDLKEIILVTSDVAWCRTHVSRRRNLDWKIYSVKQYTILSDKRN
jgi:hypothetical protein